MLYERWRQIAREHADKTAVFDVASNDRWTFSQLVQAAERFAVEGPMAFPRGHCAEFILAVLAGWRGGRPVCPLESTQAAPVLKEVPEGVAQVKLTSATTGPA